MDNKQSRRLTSETTTESTMIINDETHNQEGSNHPGYHAAAIAAPASILRAGKSTTTSITAQQDNAGEGKLQWKRMFRTHFILILLCTVIFSMLVGAGLSMSYFFAQAEESQVRDDALALAIDTGNWFSEQLDLAILPLFSLAQFAVELEVFRDLPDQIGIAGAPGSMPFVTPAATDAAAEDPRESYRRNVTGICDDPALLTKFNQIASTLKHNAQMEGVLVNLQLAPQAVVCLLYPLNNTEDFQDDIYMDNTGAWGMDLLADPISKYIAGETIKETHVKVAGPRPLRQCNDCHPAVEEAFIARLPIWSDDHVIMVDGQPYNRWGFATALINWKQLVARSGLYEAFDGNNMEFTLTRTDRTFDEATGNYKLEEVVLAATPGGHMTPGKMVSTALQTTNNEWKMTVCYGGVNIAPWRPWVTTLVIFVSLLFSWLIFCVFYQKHEHSQMLAVTLAQHAKVETERNVTAYFAHELRNPLGAIDSALRSFPEENQSEEAKSLLHGMQLSCEFMSSIMNNLLDVRKMEEGRMMLHSRPLSLSEMLNDVHRMLKTSVRPGVEFGVRCDTFGKDWVLGDEHRLKQVLTNMVTNAIKYTIQGSIFLSVEWEDDNIVRIVVADTGPGIPKKEQPRLFQRFVTRGGAPGTGLGLAISKNIVDLAGGSIRFESDPSKKEGTSCIVLIPMELCENCDPEVGETSIAKDDIMPIEENLSVLIVDDIKMNRTMFGRRIKRSVAPNCEIWEATTGEEALELCASKEFDVILIDQFMEEAGGVMVGTDAIFALRRMRIKSVIILCSGNEIRHEAIEAGADYFWSKPIPSNEDMITQIRDCLRNR